MKNKWKKVCSMAVLSAVMVTGLFGCGGNSDAQDSQKEEPRRQAARFRLSPVKMVPGPAVHLLNCLV